MRFLIVDDDPATLVALSDALRRRLPDIEIETASSAERALILMAVKQFTLILSDARMPGMDGVSFVSEIKTLCPDTLVLLMSASATDYREQAIRHGAWSFIEKPFEVDELVAALRSAIHGL
jgi:DNA-binding NtrC family response regulator